MWLVDDEEMRELLGGEYVQVVIAKEQEPSLSVRKLFNYQFEYGSYNGFRRFYNSTLSKLIGKVKFIDDDSFLGKVLLWAKGTKLIKKY